MESDLTNENEISGIVKNNINTYNYDGVYGPIPDSKTGMVDLSRYAKNYIKDYYSISEIPQENLDYLNSNLKSSSMSFMFSDASSFVGFDFVNIPKLNIDTSHCTNMSNMFNRCEKLTNVDLSEFDTSNCYNMYGMFGDCASLENLDLSNFDTSKVWNFLAMFSDCSKLKNIDGIIDMASCSDSSNYDYMFKGCNNLFNVKIKNPPQEYYDNKTKFESYIGLTSDQYEIVS